MKLLTALLLVLAAEPFQGQSQFYVDPVGGTDQVGGGSLAAPFKTMTFAVSQAASQPLTLQLLPGVYSTGSGELFPIDLPDQVTVAGVYPCGAVIDYPLEFPVVAPNAVFKLSAGAGGGVVSVLRDLVINTAHRGLQVQVGVSGSCFAEFENVRITSFRGLALTVGAGGSATVAVRESRFLGSDSSLRLVANNGAQLVVSVEGSDISGIVGVSLEPQGAATNLLYVTRNTVYRDSVTGIRAAPSNGAVINAQIDNCVFRGNGIYSIPQSPVQGAIGEATGGSLPLPQFTVSNSIFWDNIYQHDMFGYSSANYTLTTCLVEQPGLIGVGGSITGDPLFLNAEGGNYHLRPGSPAIDAGSNLTSAPPLDFEGDPRVDALGGAGIVDIGIDEYYPRYVYFKGEPKTGKSAKLHVLGTPGASYWAFLGSGVSGAPFGSGVLLTGLLTPEPIASGTIPATGEAQVSFAVPANPALAGVPMAVQAGYVEGSPLVITVSANAYEHVICVGT